MPSQALRGQITRFQRPRASQLWLSLTRAAVAYEPSWHVAKIAPQPRESGECGFISQESLKCCVVPF